MYFLWGPVRGKDVGCEVPIVRAEQIGHCPGVWRDKFFERGLCFFCLYEAMHSDVGGGRLSVALLDNVASIRLNKHVHNYNMSCPPGSHLL